MAQLNLPIREYLQSLTKAPIVDWESIESLFTYKSIKKGEHFFQHFDHCEEIAIVSSGLFRIYLTDHEGEEKTFSFIPEKSFILDFFLSWEENSKTMISVQAIENAEIYTIKYSNFLQFMQTSKIRHDIYREVLSRNYMYKTKREIEFVQFNAKQRLKMFMENRRIDVNRIPKTYLASFLGIQPPSLSRLLREMKN